MTKSELGAVEDLVLKVLADPVGLAERILGELSERLVSPPQGEGQTVVPSYESAAHEALLDRAVLLAAALGACECWGEAPTCPDCRGVGSPGWVPPDPELYAAYVAPAVRRTAPYEPPTHPSVTDDRPAEGEAG